LLAQPHRVVSGGGSAPTRAGRIPANPAVPASVSPLTNSRRLQLSRRSLMETSSAATSMDLGRTYRIDLGNPLGFRGDLPVSLHKIQPRPSFPAQPKRPRGAKCRTSRPLDLRCAHNEHAQRRAERVRCSVELDLCAVPYGASSSRTTCRTTSRVDRRWTCSSSASLIRVW